MANTIKTVDNLGLGTSVRWAQDQEFLKETAQQTKDIPLHPFYEIDVSQPRQLGEFHARFSTLQAQQQWATLTPPNGYHTQYMRIFTSQTVPSLGPYESLQAYMQRIQSHVNTASHLNNDNDKENNDDAYQQSKMLIALLQYIEELDSLILHAIGCRNQYAKG